MGKRGRKVGASGEQSRSLLLNIAAETFAEKGYHETKISTIVRKANVTQPTFYLYFKNKDAIFQELVHHFQDQLFQLIKQSRMESGLDLNTIDSKITQNLTAIFTFFKENPNITRIGFYLAKTSNDIKQQLALKIKENLVKEQQDGYFRSDIDMSTIADSLIGIIDRLTITKLFNESKEPEELGREIVHILLYGLIINTIKET